MFAKTMRHDWLKDQEVSKPMLSNQRQEAAFQEALRRQFDKNVQGYERGSLPGYPQTVDGNVLPATEYAHKPALLKGWIFHRYAVWLYADAA